ncbi:hypothetical protein ACFWOL_28510 [Streptomyces sp. NPDC058442]|uniref:hypothetical protein n=1 Tax=Streptomyces sp. NPDC058442 TaxID=3346503 RepID=UPI0036590633
MHALPAEAESRGYQMETRTDLHRGQVVHQMVIVICGNALPLAITEQDASPPSRQPEPHDVKPQISTLQRL